eukprot:SAG31_NODE_2370_length_5852_cov_2.750391_1_plen_68_part_00
MWLRDGNTCTKAHRAAERGQAARALPSKGTLAQSQADRCQLVLVRRATIAVRRARSRPPFDTISIDQ